MCPALLDLFLAYVPPLLIQQIIDDLPQATWLIRESTSHWMTPTVSLMYNCFDICIRIQGLHRFSQESNPTD